MTDCFRHSDLMPFEQAQKIILNTINAVTDKESLAIETADGRVLATQVISPLNVPPANNSAMDGYAIRDDNLVSDGNKQITFTLVGTSYAGTPFNGELNQGECIRIMTGAVVPSSANAVIMQENVETIENTIGSTIKLTQTCNHMNNIRLAGGDIAAGEVVFPAGHKLNTVDIGLLASLGLSEVNCIRPLTVAVFSTGDELKSVGEPLNSGDIYETNSQVLTAMLARMGCKVINLGIIADNKEAITQAFTRADEQADIVVSSGGVSVGEADYVKTVLDTLGQIEFWKVAIKPGKPFAFGCLQNSVFFGLPGNPVSAAVTFQQLVKPAIVKMSGANQVKPLQLSAIASNNIRKAPGRMDFQRGVYQITANGQLEVMALPAQGSGILSSISKANCFIVLEQDSAGVEKGNKVTIELFDETL